jgi:hypothetical protein
LRCGGGGGGGGGGYMLHASKHVRDMRSKAKRKGQRDKTKRIRQKRTPLLLLLLLLLPASYIAAEPFGVVFA